jgi:cytochrome c-type biogenesis protein CcsB
MFPSFAFFSGENFLSNFSFLTLFLSMLIYWVEITNLTFRTSMQINKNEENLVGSMNSNMNSFSSLPIETLNINQGQRPLLNTSATKQQNLGLIGVIFSNLSIFVLLLLRWKESGHFPLSNLYESLMFLSWTLTTIHLFLEFNLFSPHFFPLPMNQTIANKNLFMAKLIGSITTPSALFTNAFATFSLPKDMQAASPLVPALQSNWLMMHVTVMILSYGALICGSLLAIAYLVITGINIKESNSRNLSKENILPKKLEKFAYTFDNLSYRILGIGFPLLTIGILSGAVWANEAWGSYWSWDPKETWALLTWLVFAIYLHTRLNKGWQGQKPALIASLGFVSVWVCYLGVNLLGEGLHSYGWLS